MAGGRGSIRLSECCYRSPLGEYLKIFSGHLAWYRTAPKGLRRWENSASPTAPAARCHERSLVFGLLGFIGLLLWSLGFLFGLSQATTPAIILLLLWHLDHLLSVCPIIIYLWVPWCVPPPPQAPWSTGLYMIQGTPVPPWNKKGGGMVGRIRTRSNRRCM